MNDAKSKDLQLWETWKRTQSPSDLQALLTQMMPIIQREVGKWAPAMSRSLLEMEAKRLAVKAFQSYNPAAGTALSTYVASRLPKLSRTVYSNQNAARLSEANALLFHTYNAAHTQLTDDFGREPTTDELADNLGWSVKKLTQFRTQSGRKEYVESEDHPDADADSDQYLADFIHHDLPPTQKQIFEHLTGYRGVPKLGNSAVMKKLGLTQGQYSYQKGLLVKHISAIQKVHSRG
jgi:DNA-directed RNA polymerase specialized sigma subunit